MLVDYFHVKLRQSIAALLPLSATVEVISVPKRDIYPIPGVNPALLGVINHYGRLLWVLELSDFLGLPTSFSDSSETFTLVVLKGKSHDYAASAIERQFACVVARLEEITSLDPTQFESVVIPELFAAQSFLVETTTLDTTPIAVLDVESVFARLQVSDSAYSPVLTTVL
jgi:twitching motility protein PilI